MGLKIKNKGRFDRTTKFLTKASNESWINPIFDKYGRRGVDLLQQATPKDTGKTANSWEYEYNRTSTGYVLKFNNTNIASNGTPVVILLEYGHGTRNGGYVSGLNFIRPTLQRMFEQLANELWDEVTK